MKKPLEMFQRLFNLRGIKVLNSLINLYKKSEFATKLFVKARTTRMIGSSRLVEYSWVLTQIGKDTRQVLDVGSTTSLFPIELASMGYDVYSIDPRNYIEWHGSVHPDMKFIMGDICEAPFTSKFFDVVTAISTIEHIGKEDFYKIPSVDEIKDLTAIQEIARILKKDGRFIFTVPYRQKIPYSILQKRKVPFIRLYNEKTIRNRLLKGMFSIEKEEYFYMKNGFWRHASIEEMNNLGEKEGLACIVARKM